MVQANNPTNAAVSNANLNLFIDKVPRGRVNEKGSMIAEIWDCARDGISMCSLEEKVGFRRNGI